MFKREEPNSQTQVKDPIVHQIPEGATIMMEALGGIYWFKPLTGQIIEDGLQIGIAPLSLVWIDGVWQDSWIDISNHGK